MALKTFGVNSLCHSFTAITVSVTHLRQLQSLSPIYCQYSLCHSFISIAASVIHYCHYSICHPVTAITVSVTHSLPLQSLSPIHCHYSLCHAFTFTAIAVSVTVSVTHSLPLQSLSPFYCHYILCHPLTAIAVFVTLSLPLQSSSPIHCHQRLYSSFSTTPTPENNGAKILRSEQTNRHPSTRNGLNVSYISLKALMLKLQLRPAQINPGLDLTVRQASFCTRPSAHLQIRGHRHDSS